MSRQALLAVHPERSGPDDIHNIAERANLDYLEANSAEASRKILREREDVRLVVVDCRQDNFLSLLEAVRAERARGTVPILALIEENHPAQHAARVMAHGANVCVVGSAPMAELGYRIQELLFDPSLTRRSTPRVPVHFPVECQSEDAHFPGYAFNMSLGGLFLRTENLLGIGTPVSVRFLLPHSKVEMDLPGRVNWKREASQGEEQLHPPGIGVEFSDPSEDILDQLESELMALQEAGFVPHS